MTYLWPISILALSIVAHLFVRRFVAAVVLSALGAAAVFQVAALFDPALLDHSWFLVVWVQTLFGIAASAAVGAPIRAVGLDPGGRAQRLREDAE